jgi:hypothetical protein
MPGGGPDRGAQSLVRLMAGGVAGGAFVAGRRAGAR